MDNLTDLRYTFKHISSCNMCGSPAQSHKILGKRLNQSQGMNPGKKAGVTTTVIKCTNCELIYSNPQPIPFAINDHYGVNPDEYWTAGYFIQDENYFNDEIQGKDILYFHPNVSTA